MGSWYLGRHESNMDYMDYLKFVDELEKNLHIYLMDEYELSILNKSYLNINKIPTIYKDGRDYYENYDSISNSIYAKENLNKSSILMSDTQINGLARQLLTREISPLLANKKYLMGLPKAYFILVEFDELKDEGLLYAERLKEANVDCKIAFYENAFHGISNLLKINTHQIKFTFIHCFI